MARLSPIADRLFRTGLRRGVFGGSRAWLVVGIGAGVAKLGYRALARQPEVVFRAELPPGQSIVIRHTTDTHGGAGSG